MRAGLAQSGFRTISTYLSIKIPKKSRLLNGILNIYFILFFKRTKMPTLPVKFQLEKFQLGITVHEIVYSLVTCGKSDRRTESGVFSNN